MRLPPLHHFLLPLAFLLAPVRLGAQSDSGFSAWARTRAIPIDSSGRAFRALDSAASRARLIGVGESVHGVREFTTFRVALLQHLVRDQRVTAVILESGLPEAVAVDDYVRGRSDTVDFAAHLGPEFSESGEVRRALAWLREWNRGPGRSHPVAVYGADISIGDGRSMLPTLDGLRAVVDNDPRIGAVLDSLRPAAASVAAPWWNAAVQKYAASSAETKARLTRLTERLVAEARRWRGGPPDRRAWAERYALIAQQDEVMLREGPFSPDNPRDVAMAANIGWIVDRLPRGERAVVWAHNAHVQAVPIAGEAVGPRSFPSMGVRLRRALGEGYFAIGTAYGGASVDSLRPPRAGSVDAALGGIAHAPYLLLLGGAPRDGAGAWLRSARPMRFQVGHLEVALNAAFDAIVYFDQVSRADSAR